MIVSLPDSDSRLHASKLIEHAEQKNKNWDWWNPWNKSEPAKDIKSFVDADGEKVR